MAVNRYEQPTAAQFMNTYVPIPFQEMMQAGQMKQERYDRSAAAVDQAIAQAEMMRAIPGSKDEERKREYVNSIYEIRDQFADKDLSDPFVVREMNSAIRGKVNKDLVQRMDQSYTGWMEAQQGKRTLAMNNKWNPLLDEDPSAGWDSETGVYNYLPTAYTDKADLYKPYYENLNPEELGVKIDPVTGMYKQTSGITDRKIREVTSKAAQELANNPQGLQQIKLYRMNNPGSDDPNSPNYKSNVDVIRDEMYDYGKQWVSSDSRYFAGPQDRGSDGSDKFRQNRMVNVLPTKSNIEGKNDRQRIRFLENEYQKNEKILASADPNSPEYKAAEGNINKMDSANERALVRARQEIDPRLNAFKAEAFNKLRAIPEYSDMSDSEINSVIDDHLGDGFFSSLKQFGAALNNTRDIINAAPLRAGQFIGNVGRTLKVAGTPGSPASQEIVSNALDKAIRDLGKTKDEYTFGDFFRVLGKTSSNVVSDVRSTKQSEKIEKHRETDDMNILRELALKADGLQKELENSVDKYKMEEYNYTVSDKQVYPMITKKVGDNEFIVRPDGSEVASQTARLIKHLPAVLDSFQIFEAGSNKALNKKQKEEVKGIMSSWENNGAFTKVKQDDDGNTILTIGYTPTETSAKKVFKEYDVKIPPSAPEAQSIVSDFYEVGDYSTYLRFANPELSSEIKMYINSKSGHDYTIVNEDGTSDKVNVKLENGKYILTTFDGSMTFDTREEVEDALFEIQESFLLR